MSQTDVVVIGGGPAGLAAAIAARQRGLSVLVLDGNQPPIDKPCGEGLLPDARREMAVLGIELPVGGGYEFRGIRFHGEGKRVDADFPAGPGIGVRRTVLHQAIVEAAVRAGVQLQWNSPVAEFGGIEAHWIVGADGSGSRIRRWAGLDTPIWNTRRFAYRQHFAIAPWTDCMEIYWGRGCQIYVTPVGAEEVCIALISRLQGLRLAEALERFFPALHARLHGVSTVSREQGSVTATTRFRKVVRGNLALTGDASGSVDAITGEGLCLSFKQARLLADAMSRGDLEIYNRAHPRLTTRPWLMSKAMLMLDRGPAIRRLGLGVMSWQPGIFQALLRVHVA